MRHFALIAVIALASCAGTGAGQETNQPSVAPIVNINFRDADIRVTTSHSPSNAPKAAQAATTKVDPESVGKAAGEAAKKTTPAGAAEEGVKKLTGQ